MLESKPKVSSSQLFISSVLGVALGVNGVLLSIALPSGGRVPSGEPVGQKVRLRL